jgi:asparagine synthase (glutamine-hydrolysing)
MEEIFCLLNSDHQQNDFYKTEFFKGKNKCTHSQFIEKYDEIFGYHSSGLPSSSYNKDYFIIDDILLLCCGEIYNYKQLFDDIKVVPNTSWSCEIIIHLYLKFGFPHVLNHLDGIFAFVLYDMRMTGKNKIFVARDTLGVCPLYQIQTMYEKYFYGFSSNIKSIKNIEDTYKENNVDNEYFSDSSSEDPSIKRVVLFPPGTYSYYSLSYGNSKGVNWRWTLKKSNVSYMNISQHPFCIPSHIVDSLSRAVHKRCILSTNKNIACILSGEKYGNILAYLVRNYCLENDCVFHTFSIGIKEESDMHLKYTKMVANYFESKHTEVIITKEEIFNVTSEVINTIETRNNPEIIRSCCESYLLGKYISKNNDNIKIIFTDNGFDCLFEQESMQIKSEIELKINIAKKLKNIHFFKEKCISLHGIEPKTPYVDNEIIQFVLASPIKSNAEIQRFLLVFPEHFMN